MTELLKSIAAAPRWLLPFVLGGGVFAIFAWLEGQLSAAFREDCRRFIAERQYEPYLGILPDLVSRSFDWTFGDRQRSIKCFVRATEFSTAFFFVTVLITEMFNPSAIHTVIALLWALSWRAIPLVAVSWILACVVPSWIMIGKARFVIWVLQRARVTLSTLTMIMVIDFVIGSWVFLTLAGWGIALLAMEEVIRAGKVHVHLGVLSTFVSSGIVAGIIALIGAALLIPTGQLYLNVPIGNLFWASYAPSIWLWLYVFAAIITRSLARLTPVLRIAGYVLDFKAHPVKEMGLVAAVVVTGISLISVAIGSVIFAW